MITPFKILISITLFTLLYSCEKECYKERNTLETINLEKINPNGTYIVDELLSKDKMVYNLNDSTATIIYTENDTTYEFTYTIKSIGTYESKQQKF